MKKAELLKELKIDDSADTSRKTMNQKRELTDQKLLLYYCIHDKCKYQCRSRQGSGYCVDCNGKGVCKHGKQKYFCADCNGRGMCFHNKRKDFCKICPKILKLEETDCFNN